MADHEAGHAVAKLVLDRQTGRRGPPIRRVTIVPESDEWPEQHACSRGHLGVVKKDERVSSYEAFKASRGTSEEAGTREDARLMVVEFLAGPAAESLSRDWSSAQGLSRHEWPGDFREAQRWLCCLGRKGDFAAAWETAWELVETNRNTVRALGDALLRQDEIDDKEVEEVVLRTLPPGGGP